jgi:hypothetical protein
MAACRHGKSAARSGVDSVAPVLKSRDAAGRDSAVAVGRCDIGGFHLFCLSLFQPLSILVYTAR